MRMTRAMTRRLRGMTLNFMQLPNEVLVKIAKHLELHAPSLGAFRVLCHSTRHVIVARHKPIFCRVRDVPRLQAGGVVLLNIITKDQFWNDRYEIVHRITYPCVRSVQIDQIHKKEWVKNVFKIFPNIEALIATRGAIAQTFKRPVPVPGPEHSQPIPAHENMISFLAQDIGAQLVEKLVGSNPTPVARESNCWDRVRFSNFDKL